MGTRHTPGPWALNKYHEPVGPDGENIRAKGLALTNTPEALANARLIAAAPELLEALQALDAYWLESLPDGPDGSRVVMSGLGTVADDTISIWKQARAAIAKATQP